MKPCWGAVIAGWKLSPITLVESCNTDSSKYLQTSKEVIKDNKFIKLEDNEGIQIEHEHEMQKSKEKSEFRPALLDRA